MVGRAFEVAGRDAARALAAAADLLDSIAHPAIVSVADYSPTRAGARLLVEPGGAALLSAWTPADSATVAALMADVAAAVSYLHTEQIHLGGVRLSDLDISGDGRPLLADPTRWTRSRLSRHGAADLASLGRSLTRLLAATPDTPPGWRRRLSGDDERSRAMASVARAAESGRLVSAADLAKELRGLGPAISSSAQPVPEVATPSVRNRAAAESTSTARIAASNLRSLPRIVSWESAKS
jgi:hypothetical protein